MTNLEHLLENGLCEIKFNKYKNWCAIMKRDPNWRGNEHIKLDDLWEICQYIEYVKCQNCERKMDEPQTEREGE